jgi:hypothetical protein
MLCLLSMLRLLPLQVLVEGSSRRSEADLTGRTDTFKRAVFPDLPVPTSYAAIAAAAQAATPWEARGQAQAHLHQGAGAAPLVRLQPGDYVAVEVVGATGGSLLARPLARTTIAEFVAVHGTPAPLQLFGATAGCSNLQRPGAEEPLRAAL